MHVKPFSKKNPDAYLGADELDWPAIMTASESVGGVEWYIIEYRARRTFRRSSPSRRTSRASRSSEADAPGEANIGARHYRAPGPLGRNGKSFRISASSGAHRIADLEGLGIAHGLAVFGPVPA